MPRYLWKCLEGGYLRNTFDGLSKLSLKDDIFKEEDDVIVNIEGSVKSRVDRVMKFFKPNAHSNCKYFKYFFLTNFVLNFGVLGIVWWGTHRLLNDEFLTYGTELIRYLSQEDFQTKSLLINPMDYLFPKMTKCQYKRVGFSGKSLLLLEIEK